MTLHSLEFPDEPERLAASLEDVLCGANLPQLVAELRAVAADERPAVTLEQLLGPDRESLLASGLGVLPLERLRSLLQHPQLLLELQEFIYSYGGSYWLKRLRRPDDDRAAQALWPEIAESVAPASSLPVARKEAAIPRRFWLTLVAMAAVVLIAGLLQRPAGKTIAWGWGKAGVFDVALDRVPYLEHLAVTANEWFAKSPQEPAALAQRMREFREGCDQLLAAPHTQLPEEDRTWLVERCRAWSEKIDQSLLDLEQGRKPVDAVRADMNEMTNKLMAALRQRAVTT